MRPLPRRSTAAAAPATQRTRPPRTLRRSPPLDDSSDSTPTDAGADGGAAPGPVSMTATTIDWQHWNYTLNPVNTIQDYTKAPTANTEIIAPIRNTATAPFWGVINHDVHEGLFRIADNSGSTPGMKMWTWGHPQSQIDPTAVANAANGSRPYIELCGGVSHHSPGGLGPTSPRSGHRVPYEARCARPPRRVVRPARKVVPPAPYVSRRVATQATRTRSKDNTFL